MALNQNFPPQPIELRTKNKGEERLSATLREATMQDLTDLEDKWNGEYRQQHPNAAERYEKTPHAFWNWGAVIARTLNNEQHFCFVIESTRGIEGAIYMNTDSEKSRVPEGREQVYVEYLAAAPWNESKQKGAVQVGPLLLNFAIEFSLKLGLGGRIGLHAKPSAPLEDWYRKKGLREVEREPTADGPMLYFEANEAEAEQMLLNPTR
jgi:hypothetical protein